MNNIVYHEIIPNNLQTSYTEFQNVDFELSFPNRKINLGSIRLEGELEVKYDGVFLNSTAQKDPAGAGGEVNQKDIKMDGMVGAHSLFESITTTVNQPEKGKNVIENLNEYPRYAKMANSATSGRDDQNNSNNVCELKSPLDQYLNNVLQGVFPKADLTASVRKNPDFSVRPLFCLNSGEGSLS